MPDPIVVHNGNCYFTAAVLQNAVDQLIERGVDKANLRVRFGWKELHGVQTYLTSIAPLEILRYEADHGVPSMGILCGIPYSVDPSIPDGEMQLQIATAHEVCARITGNAVTRLDSEQ